MPGVGHLLLRCRRVRVVSDGLVELAARPASLAPGQLIVALGGEVPEETAVVIIEWHDSHLLGMKEGPGSLEPGPCAIST